MQRERRGKARKKGKPEEERRDGGRLFRRIRINTASSVLGVAGITLTRGPFSYTANNAG